MTIDTPSAAAATPRPINIALAELGADSYTAQRLQHATAEHLHLTTRRCFIGPIPEGWLNSHRREWYRHHLGIHYSSRAATFNAAPEFGRHRRLTGLEGPSVSASYRHSFPQPVDAGDNDADEEDADGRNDNHDDEAAALRDPVQTADGHPDAPQDAHATTLSPPAIQIPRASYDDDDDPDMRDLAHAEPIATHGDRTPEVAGTPRQPSPAPSSDRPKKDSASLKDPQASKETVVAASASVKSDDTIKPSPKSSTSALKDRPSPGVSATESSTSPLWLSAQTSLRSKEPPTIRPQHTRSASGGSFVTANEDAAETPRRLSIVDESDSKVNSPNHLSAQQSDFGDGTIGAMSSRQTSTRSLLPRDEREEANNSKDKKPQSDTASKVNGPDNQSATAASHETSQQAEASQVASPEVARAAQPGLVRFNIPEDDQSKQQLVKVRLAQVRKRDTFKRLRRGKVHDGQIVKMEKMLARVEFTAHEVPADFAETQSEKIETSTIEKWKEFMLVCRENDDDDNPFVLQLYRSRVIPAIEKARVKKRWTYQIQLRRSNCKINLFSSLDKTMVIWHPSRKGTKIYTLQARSGANSMEWYTFLRNALGWGRSSLLNISVPDLGVNLRIDKPFEKLESRDVIDAAAGDEDAILRTIKEEQAASSNLIARCMDMLEKSPEWRSVFEKWNGVERMGLAWKRYDRLEWIHGANEKKMYGTIGMEASHELELRPKQHYPTSAVSKPGQAPAIEPPPVEGFLIRLTSQRGVNQKLGKLFFKRLYFSTHNQFLVFNRPAKADPPPPPKMPMTEQAEIPSSEQISRKTPLIYSINPYPLTQDKYIEWLHGRAAPNAIEHDRDAYDENERKTNVILNCDGIINLCNVEDVRDVQRGSTPADARVEEGDDVDFNVDVTDTQRDDGTTRDMADHRTFELVMKNGLVVRLQAFDETTKAEWKSRLTSLVDYWKRRTTADIALYKQVRARNLQQLKMDEQTESYVGQFASKWEVSGSYASPEVYNMCGISCCRTIHMSGMLYRKPRMHGAFGRYLTVLVHGKLLMFADAVRNNDGTRVRHIQHERAMTLDLRDCYVYSGLITAGNLLYQSEGHDHSRHGRHALPRMYVDDGWTSTDEDTATTFVVWHGKRTSWFKSQGIEKDGHGRQRLKKVQTLGAEGRSVVFKTRSRAERDHWVMSVGMEIERLWQGEDVRVEGEA